LKSDDDNAAVNEHPTSNTQHSEKDQASTSRALGRLDGLLFGESQGRVVISVAGIDAGKVLGQAKILGIPARRIGTVGGNKLKISGNAGELECEVTEMHDLWWNSIARAMS
jgi:phosphoribosylformylglycinamidine synthase